MAGVATSRAENDAFVALRATVLERVPHSLQAVLKGGLYSQSIAAGKSFALTDETSRGVVTAGILTLTRTDEAGGRQIVQILDKGAPFGAAAAAGDALVALAPAKLLLFDAAILAGLLVEAPALERLLAAADREEMRREQERILMLGGRKISTRLAALVLQQWRRGTGTAMVELPLPRVDLAAYLGGRVETLSRAVTELREAGCLQFHDRGRIEILSLERLQDYAGPDAIRTPSADWMAQ